MTEIRARHPDVEIVSADATLGYYLRGTLPERLQSDVVAPAEARVAAPLWILGISMGGLGALMQAREHPDQVQGLLLLAPFLGEAEVIRDIQSAGGLAHWVAPPPAPLTEKNYSRQLWGWLKAHTGEGERSGKPVILLGYGQGDRLAPAAKLLADSLPAQHVRTIPGAHQWETWKRLLEEFLQDPTFLARCGP